MNRCSVKMIFFKLASGAIAVERVVIVICVSLCSAVRCAAHRNFFEILCDVRCAQSPLPSCQWIELDLLPYRRLLVEPLLHEQSPRLPRLLWCGRLRA